MVAKSHDPEPISVSVEKVPELTGWSRTQVFAFIKAGRLSSYRIGRRRIVPMAAIKRLSEELEHAQ